MTTFLGETDNTSLISKERRTHNSQASQEEPRLEYPTPKAQIHSPYQPTEDRAASLSEVDNLPMGDAENTQVYRTTESSIIHTAQFQTQQQQATPYNPHIPVSFPDCPHNYQNLRTLETPFHDTLRQEVSTQIADALVRITQQQRLPQSKPGIFAEEHKTSFFLWQNAFDALVDTVDIPAKQKLYLLNQHLSVERQRR